RSVVHCDIKPDNVMVGDHGQVYLMDWGVAVLKAERPGDVRLPGVGVEETSTMRGTPAYMAPEQFSGVTPQIDQRTDVFGLGGVLYEMLTQAPPNGHERLFGGVLRGDPVIVPRSTRLWPQVPPELRRIVSKALAHERHDRYETIAALRADLEQFIQGGGWFETRVFAAGARIVSEGERGDAAYIIDSGECEVFKESGAQRQLIRKLYRGDVFGETAVFTGSVRTASVVALTDVTLKIITGDSLNRELDRNPWVAAFVRSLAALFREADARLSSSKTGE
ncbi:MAG TPA: cyclic nucleotide-binding domain-containing protein, partial [Polyangiaceae bacterium]